MINLSGNGTLAGVAANNNQVACTISGMELAAGNETYKILGQALLVTPAGNLYTVPANTTAFIKRIFLVNTSANNQAGVILYANGTGASAGTATDQITGNFSIPAAGWAVYNEEGWTVYDNSGAMQVTGPASGRLKSRTIIAPGTVTYTVPAGVNTLFVECIGPGGGGGGANANATNNSAFAAGGGAGGYSAKLVTSLSASYTVAVGNGGGGGSAAGGNGSNGSANTTFNASGTIITASLGTGGIGQVGGATIAEVTGGAGGAAANGDLNVTGQAGQNGGRYTTVITTGVPKGQAGSGGSAPFGYGAGGWASLGGVTENGAAAPTTGNGGGGAGGAANGSAAGNGTGGAGANGVIVVWEFA